MIGRNIGIDDAPLDCAEAPSPGDDVERVYGVRLRVVNGEVEQLLHVLETCRQCASLDVTFVSMFLAQEMLRGPPLIRPLNALTRLVLRGASKTFYSKLLFPMLRVSPQLRHLELWGIAVTVNPPAEDPPFKLKTYTCHTPFRGWTWPVSRHTLVDMRLGEDLADFAALAELNAHDAAAGRGVIRCAIHARGAMILDSLAPALQSCRALQELALEASWEPASETGAPFYEGVLDALVGAPLQQLRLALTLPLLYDVREVEAELVRLLLQHHALRALSRFNLLVEPGALSAEWAWMREACTSRRIVLELGAAI